jgi:hypothetical protein
MYKWCNLALGGVKSPQTGTFLLHIGLGAFLCPAASVASNLFTADTNSPFGVGNQPYSVAVADFYGDGHPDLAIANQADNIISVLLNSAPGITANPPYLIFYASAGHAASASIPISVASAQSGSTYTVSTS